ncbi:MAG: protein BatD [Bdellovibrio sp.]|nr:MAG: protein BatD [Bdellovibrio sp.]
MTKIGSFFVVFFFVLKILSQEGVQVTATVDRSTVVLGESFTLSIRVSASESQSVEAPQLPPIEGLELLNTGEVSEVQSSFINGQFQVRRMQVFNYTLVPEKAGTLHIPAIRVSVNGKVFRTKPFSIKVLKSGQGAPSHPPSNQQPPSPLPSDPFEEMDNMFSQLLKRHGFGTDIGESELKQSFFIRLEVDKNKVYEGEQLVANWYLYTRGQILEIDTLKYPSLNGFWKEDIEIASRLNFKQAVVNGILYRKALLASYALFPMKSGKLVIDSYKARCRVMSSLGIGFGRPRYYTKASKPMKITVLPLPKEGRPDDFSGAVGQFQMGVKVETKEPQVDQPLVIKVKFAGRGNAKLIDLPPIDWPKSFEPYDVKKESQFHKDGTSFKLFEVLLIPREAGEFRVPSLHASFFNPQKKKYYTLTSQPLTIKVKESVHRGRVTQDERPLEALGQTKESESNSSGNNILNLQYQWLEPSPWHGMKRWILWGTASLIVLLILLIQAFRELGERKEKGALEKLEKRMKKIRKQLNASKWRDVGTQVINLTYEVFGYISDEGGAEDIHKLLDKVSPSVRREVGTELKKQVEYFEKLAFAPDSILETLKNKEEVRKRMDQIEKLLAKSIKLMEHDEENTNF